MITLERRFFGPGLPKEGVPGDDPTEAYNIALAFARAEALHQKGFRDMSANDIAENFDSIVRTVAEATDRFVLESGTLLANMIAELEEVSERDLRRGGEG